MWEESNLIIEGIYVDKLIRYLGNYHSREEIIEEECEELLYTKVIKERKILRS